MREYWIEHSTLTAGEVAEFLGVTRDHVDDLVRDGRLSLADDGTCTALDLNRCARTRRKSDRWDLRPWSEMRRELREKIDPLIPWTLSKEISATSTDSVLLDYARTWNVSLHSSTPGMKAGPRASGLTIIWLRLVELRLRNLATGRTRVDPEPIRPRVSLRRLNLEALSIMGTGNLSRPSRDE